MKEFTEHEMLNGWGLKAIGYTGGGYTIGKENLVSDSCLACGGRVLSEDRRLCGRCSKANGTSGAYWTRYIPYALSTLPRGAGPSALFGRLCRIVPAHAQITAEGANFHFCRANVVRWLDSKGLIDIEGLLPASRVQGYVAGLSESERQLPEDQGDYVVRRGRADDRRRGRPERPVTEWDEE